MWKVQNLPVGSGRLAILLGAIAVAVGVSVWMSATSLPPIQSTTKNSTDADGPPPVVVTDPGGGREMADGYGKWDAIAACRSFVQDRLKAPSTAKFPVSPLAVRVAGPATWDIRGYVDAQNAFGAMLRNDYRCSVSFEGKHVLLERLEFY